MSLRKKILLTLLLVVNIVVAQQRLKTPEIFFGIHGGVKASTVLFTPAVTQLDIMHSPLTANGGLVFRYAIHKVCALQVECNYMQQGWAEVYSKGEIGETLYTRHLHYIEIPLLMHVALGKKMFRGFINFGPQIGYCIADETKVSNQNTSLLVNAQHQPIDNPFDWGAAIGLGCYLKTNRIGVFQLEARFSYSLGGVFNAGQLQHFKMASPMGLYLNIGYLWEFRKNKNG